MLLKLQCSQLSLYGAKSIVCLLKPIEIMNESEKKLELPSLLSITEESLFQRKFLMGFNDGKLEVG